MICVNLHGLPCLAEVIVKVFVDMGDTISLEQPEMLDTALENCLDPSGIYVTEK